MTFDLADVIRRANEAYFALDGIAIPVSIRKRQCSRCQRGAMPDSDLCWYCYGREVVPEPWKCD